MACSPGTYQVRDASNNFAPVCTSCPAGYSCASASSGPVPCASGTFSAAGAKSCTTVTGINKVSRFPNTGLTTCPTGSMNRFGTQANGCQASAPGNYVFPWYGITISCGPGSFSSEGEACITCPAGHACPLGSSLPVPCGKGTYSGPGQASCTLCPAGSQCPTANSLNKKTCANGGTSIAGQQICTARIPGYTG